jgi:hypothetical protein
MRKLQAVLALVAQYSINYAVHIEQDLLTAADTVVLPKLDADGLVLRFNVKMREEQSISRLAIDLTVRRTLLLAAWEDAVRCNRLHEGSRSFPFIRCCRKPEKHRSASATC